MTKHSLHKSVNAKQLRGKQTKEGKAHRKALDNQQTLNKAFHELRKQHQTDGWRPDVKHLATALFERRKGMDLNKVMSM